MAFIRHPGIQGRIYVPECRPDTPRKHPCPDCFFCQQCSEDRCQTCRAKGKPIGACNPKKGRSCKDRKKGGS